MELITAAQCVPIEGAPITDGGIAVDAGKIVSVGSATALAQQFPYATRRDFPHGVLLPGLVNAHCHLDLVQFSVPKQDPTVPTDHSAHSYWLTESIRFRQAHGPDKFRDAVQYAIERLARGGVTSVGAFSSFDGAVPSVRRSGLRGVVYLELFGSNPPFFAQDRFETALAILDQPLGGNDRLRVGLGPLAPYLLSRNLLQIIRRHAESEHIPVQIHVAESMDEMEFFFNSSGPIGTNLFPLLGWGAAAEQPLPHPFQKTPLRYLEDIGFLDTAPTLVGCVQLSDADVPVVQRRQCPVVFSPRAIEHFGLGTFPYAKLAQQNIPMAFGSEALSFAVDGDLWDEMRAARQYPIGAEAILKMATLGGAHALGLAQATGSLAVGKCADYQIVDAPPDGTAPFFDRLLDHTTPANVRHVAVGGDVIKDSPAHA